MNGYYEIWQKETYGNILVEGKHLSPDDEIENRSAEIEKEEKKLSDHEERTHNATHHY